MELVRASRCWPSDEPESGEKGVHSGRVRTGDEGIYTTSVGAETLDECPMAYKAMDDIVKYIDSTVKILQVIKPIYNFKAGE